MEILNYLKIFPRVLYNPTRAFGVLASESISLTSIFANLGLPFLILGAYGRVLGEVRLSDPTSLPPIIANIFVHLLVLCIGIFLGSLMLSKLAPRYGVSVSFSSVTKISLLSYKPACLTLFISGLGFGGLYLVVVGLLAGLLFFGKGLRVFADFPPNRLVGFVFMAFLIFLGVMYFSLFLLRNFLALVY